MRAAATTSAIAVLFGLFVLSGPAAAAEKKQYLWQTNSAGNDVHVIDVETMEVVKQIVVGPEPHGIAAPSDARFVLVAIEAFGRPNGELIWIDPLSYEVTHRLTIGPKPNQLACTPDGRWAYVPCHDENYWVIDAREHKVIRKIHTGGRPHNTQASVDGRWMYLSPMGTPQRVTIVDVQADHDVVGHIPFSDSVRPPALSADNRRFFQNVDKLIGFEVADIAERKVIARIEHKIPEKYKNATSRCHGIAIRPDQKEVWSCNVEHKLVHVHDITKPDYPEITAIPMIGRIYWLCFSPDSKFAYIAVRSEKKICVVDTKSKKIVRHIDVGDTPKRNLVITVSAARQRPAPKAPPSSR